MTARETLAIAQILPDGAIARDGVLQVHSAFRGLSRQGYRAEAFIDALLTRLGPRTLLMPTMTWRMSRRSCWTGVREPGWVEVGTVLPMRS